MSVVCCQIGISATCRSLVQRSLTNCVCVIEYDRLQQFNLCTYKEYVEGGQDKKEGRKEGRKEDSADETIMT